MQFVVVFLCALGSASLLHEFESIFGKEERVISDDEFAEAAVTVLRDKVKRI